MKGKSARVDNIEAELVQAGGEEVITALTTVFNMIWQTGEWPTPAVPDLQQCQNYLTINFISHPSKVMLKIILN